MDVTKWSQMLKGGRVYRQGAKVAKGRGGRRVRGYLLLVIGEEEEEVAFSFALLKLNS